MKLFSTRTCGGEGLQEIIDSVGSTTCHRETSTSILEILFQSENSSS